MNKKSKTVFVAVALVWFFGILVWYLHKANFAVLRPAGAIASQERTLILVTFGLAMIVVVPVYALTFIIAWRYREGNDQATYQPELSGSPLAETVWWGVPTAIIIILSVITWNTSHSLDPHRRLVSATKPLNVEVIALDWKWLFIYPDQHVASVNFMQIPMNTPIDLSITADAPMNSFWIPQLGSQIYAMPGMSSPLHLIANQTGDFAGSSANISGKGFAGMHFIARAGSVADFNNWVQSAKQAADSLDMQTYSRLVKPSENNPVSLYSNADSNLYDHVILKYMAPGS